MKVYKDTTFWMLLGLYSSTVFMQRLMLHCLYFPTRSSQTQTLHTNITKINFTPRKFVKNYVYVRHWLLKQLFNGWGTVAVALLPLHVFCHLRYFRCGSGFGRIRMIFLFYVLVLSSLIFQKWYYIVRPTAHRIGWCGIGTQNHENEYILLDYLACQTPNHPGFQRSLYLARMRRIRICDALLCHWDILELISLLNVLELPSFVQTWSLTNWEFPETLRCEE